MGKVAFVFSGQGDQFPGMGRELYEQHESAARIFGLCENLRPGTLRQCFSGTEEELKKTANTQPCLFAMELAAAEVLKKWGIFPDAVAGFSLGEVVAAAAAGLFDSETGFRLVCKRGALMQAEAEKFDTAMAADAATCLKLTAQDALALGIVERILPEQELGRKPFYDRIRENLQEELAALSGDPELIQKRYDRFRKLGVIK